MFSQTYKNRSVLVTGHTGFKGSWLSEWLLKLGARVSGYSIGLPYSPCHFEQLDLHSRMAHHEGDIREFETIKKTVQKVQPEIIFHLAAQSLVRKSYQEPKITIETNAIGTLNLLEAVRETPSVQAVVLITSDKCYLNRGWDFGYRETDTLGGEDPYSASKACAELIAYTYIHSFFQDSASPWVATARAGNVIGGGDWAANRIIPDCIRAWMKEESVELRNPDHTRPWQHVLEPLSGYLWLGAQLLLRKKGVRGEAFNFGPQNRNNQSVLALVEEMKKTWRTGANYFTSSTIVTSQKEAPLLQLNCDKAGQRLQWYPTLSYEDGIRFTAEWYEQWHHQKKAARELTQNQIAQFEKAAMENQILWASSGNCRLTS